ncbi:flagellar basal body P-ring formation chaperone FlgA [Thalassospira marina]|nr:flagellar basal body P-ring formation chaperone FlgA [Thalassospira marina]PKR55935.1 flagella basal body P-ring formation protein FlgA [Thalassospira marina]
MMIRNIVAALALVVIFLLPGNGQAQEMDVLLRPQAHVEGAYVTLGDLFSGLSVEQENVAVAHAPQPGQQAVLDYRWLAGIAQRYKVNWRPRTTADQIIVTRDSQTIGIEEISDAIHDALSQNGIPAPFAVDMGGETFRIDLPVDAPAQVEITGMNVNRRTGRFIADVTTGRGTSSQRTYRMNGRYFPLEQVPVLVDPVRRGDIVRPDQVEMRDFRSDRVQANVLRDPDDVIGKEVRRSIGPGEPLLNRDFTAPILVKRGALVTIRLETANMSLTARGKALENGSLGDVIRVVNLQSNKTVQVEVTAENDVRAIPAMSQ